MMWIAECSNGDTMAVRENDQRHAFNLAETKFNNADRHVTAVRRATPAETVRYREAVDGFPPVCPGCQGTLMPPEPDGTPGDDSWYCPDCGSGWTLDLSRRTL